MSGFDIVLAESLLARSVDDTVDSKDRAAAQKLAATMLATSPDVLAALVSSTDPSDELQPGPLMSFLAEAGIEPATAVARSLNKIAAPNRGLLLAGFLNRPDLSVAVIEPLVTSNPETARMLASGTDRSDVLEQVFTCSGGTAADSVVLRDLLFNRAATPGLRARTAAALLNRHGQDPLYRYRTTLSSEMVRVLGNHPNIQQTVFDALDLPAEALLRVWAALPDWDGLAVTHLDRLVALFEQVLPTGVESLPWRELSMMLIRHPAMTEPLTGRVLAAVAAAAASSENLDTADWPAELSELAAVMAAPNRVAALLERVPRHARYQTDFWRFLLRSAPAADLVEVLTVPDTAPYARSLLLDAVQDLEYLGVCTPELFTVLPVGVFHRWRARVHNKKAVDKALSALAVSRCGHDQAVWRTFVDLVDVAEPDVTLGDLAELAASLSASLDEAR